MGAASAVLASPLDIDALIIESMYPDIARAIHNRVRAKLGIAGYLPTEILLAQLEPRLGFPASELRPIDLIAHVNCPVYVISGSEDEHTTDMESRSIFEAATSPKEFWLVNAAGHVDLYQFAGERYAVAITSFLDKYLRPEGDNI